jgi:peptide/nickel transport system substrate-binding protein
MWPRSRVQIKRLGWRSAPLHLAIVLLAALLVAPVFSATRPRYGGTLRVEIREPFETSDPPQFGPGMVDLAPSFTMTVWQGGRRAVYAADENAPGGRPFLDSIEIQLGRPLRDQALDLETGKADLVELGPNELRRAPAGRRTWSSQPVKVIALAFSPRMEDPRLREALALAVDRATIWSVLLQRQGEVSAALLPQWLSGYAFLFPVATDLPRARSLAAGGRPLTLSVADASLRAIGDRILLNARDAGIALSIAPPGSPADVRLTQARVLSMDASRSLGALAAAFGLPEPAHAETPEALYLSERALLDGYRVIPLAHVPDIYGVSPRVKGGPGITPLGEWHFGDLWLEAQRP